MRVKGACKNCKGFTYYYGNGHKGDNKPTGLWCCLEGRRIKKPPKECKKQMDNRGEA